MSYATLESLNATGITGILQTVSDAVPIFPGLIIFAIWSVLTLGMFFISVRRIGRGDFLACLVTGGLVATIVAFMMELIPNFINIQTIVVTVFLEIIFAVALISSKD
jgi:hypothetical protein